MNPTQAQTALKAINAEATSLRPSALITLFEIDIEQIAVDKGFFIEDTAKKFRFHNSVKLYDTSIYFDVDKNGILREFTALPIAAEGFETNARGTLPTPRLTISTDEDNIPLLALFKNKIRGLGDLVNAKVTRIRTFAKFLDSQNFINNKLPSGFSPDPNREFPRDIYYIDRKTLENKTMLQFELASLFDVEGIKLPGRIISARRCIFNYRGAGCLYEYSKNKTAVHEDGILPTYAPPVATVNGELIIDILRKINPTAKIGVPAQWTRNKSYVLGDSAYLPKNGINYYFVCQLAHTSGSIIPPSSLYWIAEECSKDPKGCKLRYPSGKLPFGGFPGCDRVS